MLVKDNEILPVLCTHLASAQHELNVLMYSISPATKNSHKAVKLYWQELLSAVYRTQNAKIILSQWPTSNPQAEATSNAAKELCDAGAVIKLAKLGTIMHPKAWLFDSNKLLIGSHNATAAGLTTTKNLSILSQCPLVITDYKAYFAKVWHNLA